MEDEVKTLSVVFTVYADLKDAKSPEKQIENLRLYFKRNQSYNVVNGTSIAFCPNIDIISCENVTSKKD
jgi:hypothetical protein